MNDNSKTPEHAWPRRFTGMVFLPVVVFAFMALLSYDWRDVSELQVPVNTPPANLFGVAGATCVYLGYQFFGFAVWLLPCWLLVLAFVLISSRGKRLLWRNIGFLIFLVNASIAFALLPRAWLAEFGAALNIDQFGGVGDLFAGWLVGWFNTMGAWIFAACGLLVGFVMAVGVHNLIRAFQFLVYKREKPVVEEPADNDALEPEPAAEPQPNFFARIFRRNKPIEEEFSDSPVAADEPPPESKDDRERRRIENLRKRADDIRRAVKDERKHPDASAPKRPAAPRGNAPAVPRRAPAVEAEPAVAPAQYILPSIDLLDPIPNTKADHGDVETTGTLIVQTLLEFGLQTELTGVERGPVVTQYQLLPAMGIRVEKIATLAATLQLVLKATGLRVQTPVPGKGVVGIEVPNKVAQPVTLREVCSSEAWAMNRMEIPLALGKDVSGRDLFFDLTQAPHLLVAGASGSGKSVGLNAILSGLLLTRKPDELRLMLVDPKRVEFTTYNDIPHLLVPVITDPKKVAFGLRWLIMEMDRRYKILQKARVRNIVTFNNRPEATQIHLDLERGVSDPFAPPAKLPYIVIVIDEMADLMLTVGKEIEESITRLAALSRAVGIHMIIATQRPSVNVITGTIKANFPGRISFKVAQRNDSRTILDGQGAEALIGHGDMLFLNPKNSRLLRAQGAWISEDEVHRLTEHCRGQGKPSYDVGLTHRMDKIQETKPEEILGIDGDDDDSTPSAAALPGDDAELSEEEKIIRSAINIIRETRRASTSSIQRRLRLGYTRAARIMDILEERGIVGPPRGADPREILIDLDGEIPAHISEVINANNNDNFDDADDDPPNDDDLDDLPDIDDEADDKER